VTEARAPLTNWAGNHQYTAATPQHPRSLDELRQVIADAGSVHVLNTRHTFSAMGDAEVLVALDRLADAEAIQIDRATMTVNVGPAVTYARLAVALEAEGLALANMASLPHISVSGAIATGTHGSGDRLGNLATSVRALRLLTSGGDELEITAEDPHFPGAVVHLGALGIVTQVTLAIEPSYQLRQDVYLGMAWETLAENLDAITSAGRSVSVFHNFGEEAREVWVKRDPSAEPAPGRELFGAVAATTPRNPVLGADPINCTPQLGEPGPWHERLPHFRAGFVPSAGDEIQSEWFVAREDGMAALRALRELAHLIQPILYVSEMRTIAADELWASPHYRRDSIAVHFTWHLEPAAVAAACVEVERTLAPFSPRRHWGKAFGASGATVTDSVPRLDDFLKLRDELDPSGKFVNPWFREKLLSTP